MPDDEGAVARSVAADLAQSLAQLYADTAARIAAEIARNLAAGIDSPDWVLDKQRALATLRRWLANVIRQLERDSSGRVAQALVLAYIRGSTAGLAEIARLQRLGVDTRGIASILARLRAAVAGPHPSMAQVQAELDQIRTALPGIDALQALMWSLDSTLTGTHLRILRWSVDAYRTVVAQASTSALMGLNTRRRAAQVAWETLLAQGVTGFTDKAGRRWELASYVEMATRTVTAHAAITGHLDRLGDAGMDLIVVADAPQECARCRPWEGKILRRTGPPGRSTVEVEHAYIDGRMITVQVDGSFPEAVAAGLFHPNCRHAISGYIPGVSNPPVMTEDEQGDEDRAALRALERKVRRAKLQAAGALDPAARRAAEAKVRGLQAQIRAHVAATGLIRQRPREQIGVAR